MFDGVGQTRWTANRQATVAVALNEAKVAVKMKEEAEAPAPKHPPNHSVHFLELWEWWCFFCFLFERLFWGFVDFFDNIFIYFLRAVFLRFVVSRKFGPLQNPRMKQNTHPPLLFALTELPNVTSPKTLENRFVPFPVFCWCQSHATAAIAQADASAKVKEEAEVCEHLGVWLLWIRDGWRWMEELLVGVFLEGLRKHVCVYSRIVRIIHRWVILYTLYLPVGLIAYSEQKERKDINEFSQIDPDICGKDVLLFCFWDEGDGEILTWKLSKSY